MNFKKPSGISNSGACWRIVVNERDFIRAEWLIGAALVAGAAASGRGEAFAQPHPESKTPGFSKNVSPDNHILANASPLQGTERDNHTLANVSPLQGTERDKRDLVFAKLRFIQATTADRRPKTELSSVVGQRSSVADAIAQARKHAARAKERAWCDGAPYHYKVAYERAESLLARIEQELE